MACFQRRCRLPLEMAQQTTPVQHHQHGRDLQTSWSQSIIDCPASVRGCPDFKSMRESLEFRQYQVETENVTYLNVENKKIKETLLIFRPVV